MLHVPTVRVKQLAERPGATPTRTALRELFDLDPARPGSVTAVRRAEPVDADLLDVDGAGSDGAVPDGGAGSDGAGSGGTDAPGTDAPGSPGTVIG